jgi:hypothetical protein
MAKRATKRTRVLRWCGVLVGIAAIVAGGLLYRHYMASATVIANCVDDTNQHVVNEQYCDQNYVDSHSIAGLYSYYYGGSVRNGTMSGGSYTQPDLGILKTTNGTVLQRAAFEVPDSGGSDGSAGDQAGNGDSGAGADNGGADNGGVDDGGDIGAGDGGGDG